MLQCTPVPELASQHNGTMEAVATRADQDPVDPILMAPAVLEVLVVLVAAVRKVHHPEDRVGVAAVAMAVLVVLADTEALVVVAAAVAVAEVVADPLSKGPATTTFLLPPRSSL
mgnify:CR=1 FL=1